MTLGHARSKASHLYPTNTQEAQIGFGTSSWLNSTLRFVRLKITKWQERKSFPASAIHLGGIHIVIAPARATSALG
jgi:hypothetical protein